jgi:phosphate transport system substrate-binding protein
LRKRICSIWFCSSVVLSVFPGAQAAEIIRVGGAGAGLGTMRLLGDAFERKHPDTSVQVYPSLGSAGGILALSRGALDIALTARPPGEQDGAGRFAATQYARTPFVFITHRNVGKLNMTARELEDIYRGRTGTWPDGSPIRLVLRPASDTATKVVSSISKQAGQAVKLARSKKAHILAITDHDCTSTVAELAGAFGTATLTQLATEKQAVKVLSFEGVAPSLKTLSDGSYSLSLPLYLVTNSFTHPTARQFARFVFSAEGRRILSKTGNIISGALHDN